jgi:hypothetical protein
VQLFLQFFGAAAGQGDRGHIGILGGEKQTAALEQSADCWRAAGPGELEEKGV